MKKRLISILLCTLFVFSSTYIYANDTSQPDASGADMSGTPDTTVDPSTESEEIPDPEVNENNNTQSGTEPGSESESDSGTEQEPIQTFTVKVYASVDDWANECEPVLEVEVEEGECAEEPVSLSLDGYKLVRWCLVGATDPEFSFDTPIYEDSEIYAEWESIYANITINYYLEGETDYVLEKTETDVKKVGEFISIDPEPIEGYVFDAQNSTFVMTLGKGDNVFNLYYNRGLFDYEIRFVDSLTGEELRDPILLHDFFDEKVICTAEEIPNYSVDGYEVQELVINAETEESLAKNVVIFTYIENEAEILYKLAGASEGAVLDITYENVRMFSGEPYGATPIVSDGYLFDGWYYDEACTDPVPAGLVGSGGHFVPAKNYDSLEIDRPYFEDATYYAKIIRAYADLTVSSDMDDGAFLYRIEGVDAYTSGISVTVAVSDGSVTVKDLPLGEYRVYEIKDWSWRYTADSDYKTVVIGERSSNNVVFTHTRTVDKWLSGAAEFIANWFGF